MCSEETGKRPLWPSVLAGVAITLLAGIDLAGTDNSASGTNSKEPREIWWSLKPLDKPQIPPLVEGKFRGWPRTPIDRFVLAKLREKGFQPSAPADKRTLLRRVYFDLAGLPPTPREMEDFLKD